MHPSTRAPGSCWQSSHLDVSAGELVIGGPGRLALQHHVLHQVPGHVPRSEGLLEECGGLQQPVPQSQACSGDSCGLNRLLVCCWLEEC